MTEIRGQRSEISFVPFETRHLFEIKPNGVQVEFGPLLRRPDQIDGLEIGGMSGSCIDGIRIVGCAGILPQWPGRAIGWAVFGDVPRRAWPALTRHVLAGLDECQANGTRRIETAVLAGFSAAHRWARKLGFRPEHPMESYGLNGETYWMYARIR